MSRRTGNAAARAMRRTPDDAGPNSATSRQRRMDRPSVGAADPGPQRAITVNLALAPPLDSSAGGLPDFLPGRLFQRAGTSRDYAELACFHYRARRPATWAAVVAIVHAHAGCERAAAVGVLSWPTAVSRPRRAVFGLDSLGYGGQIRWANANLRTISRVIVHPQFRGLGLAVCIVRALCGACPTRYVEATAAMGAAHPLFERAGMTRHIPETNRTRNDDPAYYWLDRTRSVSNK